MKKDRKLKKLQSKQAYQIDQSIKIEETNKTSYVCLANGKILISSISARDKKELKLFFRKLEKPLIFKLFTFSVLCAKIIFEAKIAVISIDEEYSGHEIDIKSFITQLLTIWGNTNTNISFTRVGKNSKAHIEGYNAYKKNNKGIIISAEEVLILYNKIDKP